MLLLALGLAVAGFVVLLLAFLLEARARERARALANLIASRLLLLLPRIRALVTARRRRIAAGWLDKNTALGAPRSWIAGGPYRTPTPPVRHAPRRPPATSIPGPGVSVLMALAVFALAGCGASAADIATKTVSAADEVYIVGAPAFEQFDLQYQRSLEPQGAEAIAAYRVNQARVVDGFHALAGALHAAKGALALADAGGAVDFAAVIGVLYSAGVMLYEASRAIGFSVPGLDGLLGTIAPSPAASPPKPPPAPAVKPQATALALEVG